MSDDTITYPEPDEPAFPTDNNYHNLLVVVKVLIENGALTWNELEAESREALADMKEHMQGHELNDMREAEGLPRNPLDCEGGENNAT